MNSETKNSVIQEIYDICNNVSFPPKDGEWRSVKEISGQVNFSISNETLERYNKLCKLFLEKNKWSSKFSESYLDSKLQSLIAEILKASDKEKEILHQLNSLIAQYENYSTKYRVYIPLSGIKMNVDRIDIGNIVLRTVKESYIEKIAKDVTSKIFMERIVSEFQGKVCSEYNIIADAKRAKERAEEETRRVLDLLRYSIPFLYSKSMRVTIGLEHEVIRAARSSLVLENEGNSFSSFGELIGPLVPFDISEKNIEHMKRIGVFTLSDTLKKDYVSLNDFERVLLRSLHWFANAQETIEKEQAFLNLIICLETLLTPKNRDPIANAIAEGVAFILCEELEGRKSIKRFIKKLYKKRSGISHGGHVEILDVDFLRIRNICRGLLEQMIKKKDEFSSQEMLSEWIENQKLT